MKKLLIKIAFLLLFLPSSSIAETNEFFCLDKDGFIYPLFDSEKCENKDDEKINKNELSNIIDYEKNLRISELKKFREIKKNIVKKIEPDNKVNEKKILPDKDKDQKNIAKVANELKNRAKEIQNDLKDEERLAIKKREGYQKKRKLANKKKQELKKQQRLAAVKKRKEEREKKRIAIKKEKELKKQKKLANLEKKRKEKELKKQKKLADLEKKRKKEEKLKAEKEKAKNKIQTVENVNNNLKIVYLNNKIIKNELFPKINPNKEIDYSQIEGLNEEKVKNLFANNSNLILIIPKDFDAFSTVVSENEITSKYVAGTRSVPNPEISRIEAELRSAERDYIIAERKFQRASNAATNYNPYGGWASVINQWAGLAGQTAAAEQRSNARQRYEQWSAKLSSTPMYLENEVLRNYNYIAHKVKAEKNAIYQIIQSKNYNYIEKNISISKNKNYKIAYNIDPEDKNYENLLNKYSDEKELTRWQNQKLSNISINELMKIIENENNFNEIPGKKELYASLNIKTIEEEPKEELSWWQKLFESSKKKENKTTSLNIQSNSSFELKDARFDSVVIVKTEKGLGSGFFISEDEILTNYHVIEKASTITVINKFNKRSSAVVIKKDLKRDLALLKTNMTGKPVFFFEGQLKQGEQVEALGHPKGRKFSLTKGWISAIRMESGGYSATNEKNVLFIQTDAAINHGNSGGPLYYKDKVIGVNTQGLNKENSEGMNFAVHFSEVQKFLSLK